MLGGSRGAHEANLNASAQKRLSDANEEFLKRNEEKRYLSERMRRKRRKRSREVRKRKQEDRGEEEKRRTEQNRTEAKRTEEKEQVNTCCGISVAETSAYRKRIFDTLLIPIPNAFAAKQCSKTAVPK